MLDDQDKKKLNELFTEDEQELIIDWLCSNIKSYIWDDVRMLVANESIKFNRTSICTEIETQLRKAKVITARKSGDDIKGLNAFFEHMDALDIIGESVSDVYNYYEKFCNENKMSRVSKKLFGIELRKEFGLDVVVTTRDNKSTRIYIKK